MNIDISTKTAKIENLQGNVINVLTEIKQLQKESGYKTSDVVARLSADPDLVRVVIELLLVMSGFEKVSVDENC